MSEALGITFEEIDRAGVVTLDRPTRLNALNREMFEALTAHYRRWAPNPQIYGVVMQSSHPSAFSSGGDLKVLHDWSEQGALSAIRQFYRAAYTHVWVLEKFIRPNVPLIDGLCLGGGIGIISVRHALRRGGGLSLRHAASRHRLPPRYRRHLFPAAHAGLDRALSRLDREHHRPRRGLSASARQPLRARGAFRRDHGCAARQSSDRPAARRIAQRSRRRRARAAHPADRPHLLARLGRGEFSKELDSEQGEDETFARETAAEIRKKSPTSLKIAFGQFKRGKSLSLTEALKLEFRLMSHLVAQPRLSRGDRRAHRRQRPRAAMAAGHPGWRR